MKVLGGVVGLATMATLSLPAVADARLHGEIFTRLCVETRAEVQAFSNRARALGAAPAQPLMPLEGEARNYTLSAGGHTFIATAQTVVSAQSANRQCVVMAPSAMPRPVEAQVTQALGFGTPFRRVDQGGNRFTLWTAGRVAPGAEIALIERVPRDNPSVTLSFQHVMARN